MKHKTKALVVMLLVLMFTFTPFKAMALERLEMNQTKVNKAICDLRM